MPSYFDLELDTTAPSNPSIELNGGAGSTSNQVVTATISTDDVDTTGYQIKIWGDIDPTYDSNVQPVENGTQQVETATVTGTATDSGDITVTVTGANVGNSPKPIIVAILDEDTASIVAGKIRTALGEESDITTNYTVSGSGADVVLTRNIATTNDTTLNIAIDGNSLGIDDLTTSTNTTAGVLGSSWISYTTSKDVKLSETDGTKTVYLKIRDDVGNSTTEVFDSIVLNTTSPVIAIMSGPTPSKISKVVGFNTSTIEWQSDEDFVEYKVRVVPTTGSAHDTGDAIPTTAGSTNTSGEGTFPLETNITTTIRGTDLETASAGDGVKIVKVFVKDEAGNWST